MLKQSKLNTTLILILAILLLSGCKQSNTKSSNSLSESITLRIVNILDEKDSRQLQDLYIHKNLDSLNLEEPSIQEINDFLNTYTKSTNIYINRNNTKNGSTEALIKTSDNIYKLNISFEVDSSNNIGLNRLQIISAKTLAYNNYSNLELEASKEKSFEYIHNQDESFDNLPMYYKNYKIIDGNVVEYNINSRKLRKVHIKLLKINESTKTDINSLFGESSAMLNDIVYYRTPANNKYIKFEFNDNSTIKKISTVGELNNNWIEIDKLGG